MNLSMVIPLAGTDRGECLSIRQKMQVPTSAGPPADPSAPAIRDIVARVLAAYPNPDATRYIEEPERRFWSEVYKLPDAAQILIMQSYDAFNADAAQNIELKRPAPELLWRYRESVVGEFYGGLSMKLKMILHVLRRSGGLHDAAAYMTLMGRKYDPAAKMRPLATL